jgi:hypothetical protein
MYIIEIPKLVGENKMPNAFISYSWDDEKHKSWVKELATRLRGDGVDVTLDQWHLNYNDELVKFMEQSIATADFVLIICTTNYKNKADNRLGGVGIEASIITSQACIQNNFHKFIPVLREGEWLQAAPIWLTGRYYADLREISYSKRYYDILATIHNIKEQAPPIGPVPIERLQAMFQTTHVYDDIKINGIIINEVFSPKKADLLDKTLFNVPFKLSRKPSSQWEKAFMSVVNNSTHSKSINLPQIACIQGDMIILNGVKIEDIETHHRSTLLQSVKRANEIERKHMQEQGILVEQKAKGNIHLS